MSDQLLYIFSGHNLSNFLSLVQMMFSKAHVVFESTRLYIIDLLEVDSSAHHSFEMPYSRHRDNFAPVRAWAVLPTSNKYIYSIGTS